jgi:protein-L-isoaspartate O-methyltransferase
MATISCPHSYPLFYEPLGLAEGQKFVEIGLGSGYGAALAREIVGQTGLVVSMDIDPVTFAFAPGALSILLVTQGRSPVQNVIPEQSRGSRRNCSKEG